MGGAKPLGVPRSAVLFAGLFGALATAFITLMGEFFLLRRAQAAAARESFLLDDEDDELSKPFALAPAPETQPPLALPPRSVPPPAAAATPASAPPPDTSDPQVEFSVPPPGVTEPTSSAPPGAPPRPGSSAPPGALASPILRRAPTTPVVAVPPGGGSFVPPSAPPVPAVAPTASGESPAEGPSTMLPPAKSSDSGFHATVTYDATNLDARHRERGVPVTRTTQMLGSPLSPEAQPVSRPSGRVRQGSATTRYSFVSTPPPAGGEPVRPHDVGPDWSPDPSIDPAPCRPLCRELFAFGVEHCFVVGVTAVPGLDRDKAEFSAALALALSATGHARVLLVEGDLDAPQQHTFMRAEMPEGESFSRQLQAHMTRQAGEHWSVLRCTKSLHVLVDGEEHTPGLILSRTFEECVRALRAYYDFIVLDGPTGARESECRALDGVIDGLIVVCTEETRATIPETSRYFTTKRFSKAIRATR